MTVAERRRSVAVIGGGITGLAAAWSLIRRSGDTDVTLYEAGSRLGGQIRTLEVGGGIVEAGPDSFVTREPRVEDLCRALGLTDDLVAPDVFGAAVWVGGRLRRFPEASFWGIPSGVQSTLRAQPLTAPARMRALGDLFSPRPLGGNDVSVADFIGRRFGTQVLQRLVDPLLVGTRAGNVDELSLAAALPEVDGVARAHRSVMRGARLLRGRGRSANSPAFLGIRGGMERLVQTLGASLRQRAELVTGARVDLLQSSGGAYEIAFHSRPTERFDGVVVCIPAPVAGRLLRELSSEAACILEEIAYAPVVSIALVYGKNRFDVPVGTSGVLVPSTERKTISACTWWSTKWRHSAADRQIVRCFVTSARGEPVPPDDAELVNGCVADLQEITRSRAEPEEHVVTRWEEGLPRYRLGHLERIDAIEKALSRHPGVALAGAAYRGAGIPDCIAQADDAAVGVLSRL